MSDNPVPNDDASSKIRGLWDTAVPERHKFAAVVNELNAAKLVGEASMFERGPHVQITNFGYFKPPFDASLTELKTKDGRSAKEWEYINGGGVRVEAGLSCFSTIKEGECSSEVFSRQLALDEKSFKSALEILYMRAQYFIDTTEHGMEEARQMAYLVEQGNDAVHSESYRTEREALTGKLEIEAAKQLAKSRLEGSKNKKPSGGEPAGKQ